MLHSAHGNTELDARGNTSQSSSRRSGSREAWTRVFHSSASRGSEEREYSFRDDVEGRQEAGTCRTFGTSSQRDAIGLRGVREEGPWRSHCDCGAPVGAHPPKRHACGDVDLVQSHPLRGLAGVFRPEQRRDRIGDGLFAGLLPTALSSLIGGASQFLPVAQCAPAPRRQLNIWADASSSR